MSYYTSLTGLKNAHGVEHQALALIDRLAVREIARDDLVGGILLTVRVEDASYDFISLFGPLRGSQNGVVDGCLQSPSLEIRRTQVDGKGARAEHDWKDDGEEDCDRAASL